MRQFIETKDGIFVPLDDIQAYRRIKDGTFLIETLNKDFTTHTDIGGLPVRIIPNTEWECLSAYIDDDDGKWKYCTQDILGWAMDSHGMIDRITLEGIERYDRDSQAIVLRKIGTLRVWQPFNQTWDTAEEWLESLRP